jgi:hypothetical protein
LACDEVVLKEEKTPSLNVPLEHENLRQTH